MELDLKTEVCDTLFDELEDISNEEANSLSSSSLSSPEISRSPNIYEVIDLNDKAQLAC